MAAKKPLTRNVKVQPRWKSIPLWFAIAALINLVAKSWFNYDIPNWAEISTTVISILAVILGIYNSPKLKGEL